MKINYLFAFLSLAAVVTSLAARRSVPALEEMAPLPQGFLPRVWTGCDKNTHIKLSGKRIAKEAPESNHFFNLLKNYGYVMSFRSDGTYTSNEEYNGCVTMPGFQTGRWQVCGTTVRLTASSSAAHFLGVSEWTFPESVLKTGFQVGQPFSILMNGQTNDWKIKSSSTIVMPAADPQGGCGPVIAPGNIFAQRPVYVWELVRHIPPSQKNWFPSNHQNTGTYSKDTNAPYFSTNHFEQASDVEEVMYATGNFEKWIIVKKTDVTNRGSNTQPNAISSSLHPAGSSTYQLETGPKVSLKACNHNSVSRSLLSLFPGSNMGRCNPDTLYAEGLEGGTTPEYQLSQNTYKDNNGLNVYIKKRLNIA
jgi:hypothetical protein